MVWLSGERGVQQMGSGAGGKNWANLLCSLSISSCERFSRAETAEVKLLSYQIG